MSAPLVVVGDTLLDRDLDGSVDRLSPDAPVPVVDEPVEHARPGGAGLAALLAAADGRDVVAGHRAVRGRRRRPAARPARAGGVRVVDLGARGATPEKMRVRARAAACCAWTAAARPAPAGDLTDEARAVLAGAGAVLVADYGRGCRARPGSARGPDGAAAPHPGGLGPAPARPGAGARRHPRHPERRGGRALRARPRRRPARRRDRPGPRAAGPLVGRRGRRHARRPRVRCVVEGDTPPSVVPAPAVPLPRPLRRGRPVRLRRRRPARRRRAAQRGGRGGGRRAPARSWPPAAPRRCASAAPSPSAGSSVEAAAAVVARVRAAGGTVVATGGCFDLLHAGHVAVLQQAARTRRLPGGAAQLRRLRAPAQGPGAAAAVRGRPGRVLRALGCVDAVAGLRRGHPERGADGAAARTSGSRAATTPSPPSRRPTWSRGGAARPSCCRTSTAAPPPT